jgi:hypothetical protein
LATDVFIRERFSSIFVFNKSATGLLRDRRQSTTQQQKQPSSSQQEQSSTTSLLSRQQQQQQQQQNNRLLKQTKSPKPPFAQLVQVLRDGFLFF